MSPHFLFRVELDADPSSPDVHLLSPHELATRMSYFLWSTMPDADLRAAAVDGSLVELDVIEAQVRRMLEDDKAEALVDNFASQWLFLREFDEHEAEYSLFPQFDVAALLQTCGANEPAEPGHSNTVTTAMFAGLSAVHCTGDHTRSGAGRIVSNGYNIGLPSGRTIAITSYATDGTPAPVDFVRFGRIALVYQPLDEAEAGGWDRERRTWQPLESGYRSAIRDGLRIARKQIAPDMIRLPLPAARPAGGPS